MLQMVQAIGSMVAGGISGYFSGRAARTQAKVNNILGRANAEADNLNRDSRNKTQVAQSNLARWVQSVNNNRALDVGGKNLEAITVNAARARDAEQRSSFSERIRMAEQQGAALAAQAAAGVAGSTADAVNATTALRNSIILQERDDYRTQSLYDEGSKKANVFSQMVGGLDTSLIYASIDYGRSTWVDQPTKSSIWMDVAQGVFGSQAGQQLLSNGISSAAQWAKDTWTNMTTPSYTSGQGWTSEGSGFGDLGYTIPGGTGFGSGASFSFSPKESFNSYYTL